MGFSGALLAMSAVQGIAQIGQGNAQAATDNYNAQIASNQASAIQTQGQIEQGQITRKGGKMASTTTAVAGAAGLQLTGSVAAVELSNQTQIETDKAIAQYNTSMGVNSATDRAQMLRQQASADKSSGYTNAFSSILKGVSQYGMYNSKQSGFNLNSGADQLPDFSPLKV